MHQFTPEQSCLIQPDIVTLLMQIREYRGQQASLESLRSDILPGLMRSTALESVTSSCRLAGITTEESRLKKLVLEKILPRTRAEQEIAGYSDVRKNIERNYSFFTLTPATLLQFHRDLFGFTGKPTGGTFRTRELATPGSSGDFVFSHVAASEVSAATDLACRSYNDDLAAGKWDPLLRIPVFLMDLWCIHPFLDGNSRMVRLLGQLLLLQSGYLAGRYASLDRILEDSQELFCQVIRSSAEGWDENQNDYAPVVRCFLTILRDAYQEMYERIDHLTLKRVTKPDRIREMIRNAPGTITKTELMHLCPDISQVTVQRTLRDLQKSGEIRKISGGRYSTYEWVNRKGEV